MIHEVSDRDSIEAEDDNNNDDDQELASAAPVRVSGTTRLKQEPDQIDTRPFDSSNGFPNNNNNINISNNNYSSQAAQEHYQNNDQMPSDRANGQHSDEPEQMRKLFIGGLDYKTSEATLKQHFEKFGDVLDCVVMREPQSKRSRGFGFIIYSDSLMVDRAQEARPHEVDGREVQSKRAISREDSGKPEAQATVKKVYLGGLSDDIEEAELRDYFKNFGNIINVNIVAHKDTGKRRGFAFVEYDDYDPVDKIVLKKFHTIRDKRIEAKKAIPKVEMDARKRGDPRAALAGAMMALTAQPLECASMRSRSNRNGSASACMWSDAPYGSGGYPNNYPNQSSRKYLTNIIEERYPKVLCTIITDQPFQLASQVNGYPPHYEAAGVSYGVNNWVMHGSQGGPYGFRGAHGATHGRNSYGNPANWTSTAVGYNTFQASQNNGSGGPMRLSYQHRNWSPYGGGYGSHRGRGYNS